MPSRVKYYVNEIRLFEDLLSRYVCFHDGEDMSKIYCWGLATYGLIRPVRERGLIISDVRKEEKQGWFRPTKEILETVIKPAYYAYTRLYNDVDIYKHNYRVYINLAIKEQLIHVGSYVYMPAVDSYGVVKSIKKDEKTNCLRYFIVYENNENKREILYADEFQLAKK